MYRTSLLTMFAISLLGCAAAQPYQTKLDYQTLQAPPQQDRDGVSVLAVPITFQNVSEHPDLTIWLHSFEPDTKMATNHFGGANLGGSSPGSRPTPNGVDGIGGPVIKRFAEVPLAPLPAVSLRIRNSSQHTLRFDHVSVQAHDRRGKTFPAMLDLADVQGRIQADLIGQNSRLAQMSGVSEEIRSSVTQLPWLRSSTVIRPGEVWQGFLAFSHPVHNADEFNDFIQKADGLTMTISGATLDGTPLALSEFSFARQAVPTMLICPAEVKHPSFADCNIDAGHGSEPVSQ
jgi:hypothetical protein